MKRRGVLGFLGGAAVAGPSMAKSAIASGLEGLAVNVDASIMQAAIGHGGYSTGMPTAAYPSDEYSPLKWAKKELTDFLGQSAEELHRRRLETNVHALDPDIAVMRSISLTHKIRMQRDRNFERQQAQQKGWLEQNIKRILLNEQQH